MTNFVENNPICRTSGRFYSFFLMILETSLNILEFARRQKSQQNSLDLVTVWRVVIEKCVTGGNLL